VKGRPREVLDAGKKDSKKRKKNRKKKAKSERGKVVDFVGHKGDPPESFGWAGNAVWGRIGANGGK